MNIVRISVRMSFFLFEFKTKAFILLLNVVSASNLAYCKFWDYFKNACSLTSFLALNTQKSKFYKFACPVEGNLTLEQPNRSFWPFCVFKVSYFFLNTSCSAFISNISLQNVLHQYYVFSVLSLAVFISAISNYRSFSHSVNSLFVYFTLVLLLPRLSKLDILFFTYKPIYS